MNKRIVVFGSFVVDLTARTPRLPTPGETVLGKSFAMGPGGKGSNQAVAAHRAGGDVTLVTKVGRDVFGTVAMDFYHKEGMDTAYILEDPDGESGCALIPPPTAMRSGSKIYWQLLICMAMRQAYLRMHSIASSSPQFAMENTFSPSSSSSGICFFSATIRISPGTPPVWANVHSGFMGSLLSVSR